MHKFEAWRGEADAEVSTEEIVDILATRDGCAGIAKRAVRATLELCKG